MELAVWLVVVLSLFSLISAQQQGNLRKRKRDRSRPQDLKNRDNSGRLFNSLSIYYPLSIFDPTSTKDWRAPGVYNEELATLSTAEKHYIDVSRAQDQEDVWLYENWFYGVKDGIIMESGALDGLLFSNSFMFEVFANWTALHVGKFGDCLTSDRINHVQLDFRGGSCQLRQSEGKPHQCNQRQRSVVQRAQTLALFKLGSYSSERLH